MRRRTSRGLRSRHNGVGHKERAGAQVIGNDAERGCCLPSAFTFTKSFRSADDGFEKIGFKNRNARPAKWTHALEAHAARARGNFSLILAIKSLRSHPAVRDEDGDRFYRFWKLGLCKFEENG